MRILYDARFITPQRTGVGRCTEQLLEACLNNSSPHEIVVLFKDPIQIFLIAGDSIRTNVAFDDHPGGDIFRNFKLRKIINRKKIDLFYSPAFYSTQLPLKIPQVVTIHDMAVFDQPEAYSLKFAWYLRRITGSACARADIITVSTEFVASRVKHYFPKTSSKIRIVPFGVSELFFNRESKDSDERVIEKWALPRDFIVCVSTVETRKNLIAMMNAYSIYLRRCKKPLPLIIAGKDGHGAASIRRRAEAADLLPYIRFLGYVSDEEIATLYRQAAFSVFTSKYEGFGLPILESMASCCPVLTSNCTSLPEVAGNAAYLIDPLSEIEIAEALLEMTNSAELRDQLIVSGIKRADLFRWDAAGKSIMRLFEEVVN